MVTTSPETATDLLSPTSASVIDVDLHHRISNWGEIAPFAPEGLRHRFTRKGGPPMAQHGYRPIARSTEAAFASNPATVQERYLDPHGVDRAILTGTVVSLNVQPNLDLASAIARAVNDWTLATWVRPSTRFKGSILIAAQDPVQAVAEIDRLGTDPGMVQVLMGSASETPLGRRHYHPIYDACVRHNLPLALHFGGEGAGMAPPASAVGHPDTTFGWYGGLPQSYMAHVMSMISEGVFARFPSLKVVLYESGVFWWPHVMWRFDKNWKAQRSETPWVTEPPSAYIRRHFYATSYPLELPPNHETLAQVLNIIEAERTLLFGSAYPDWDDGDPFEMILDCPASLQPRIMAENAIALYGDRLFAPNQ